MKTVAPFLAVPSLAVQLLLGGGIASHASTAIQMDVGANPLVAFDPEFVFGWEFLLSEPIQIHHIGLFDFESDGFAHLWKVVIFNVDGGGRNAVEFDQTTLTDDGFSYVESVAELHDNVVIHGPILAPGHYVIAAGSLVFGDGDRGIAGDLMPTQAASFVTDPVITFVQGRSGLNEFHNEDIVFPDTAEPGLKYFGPNFQFDVVPEPSIGLLLAAGAVSWGLRRRRRTINTVPV